MRLLALAVFCLGLVQGAPAQADGFSAVTDKGRFLDLVAGRELRIGAYGLSLRVLPDGRIEGKAMGREVSGSWAWKDGYFCRQMQWGKREIPYNCQLVEASGTSVMRFTVDQGRGQSADFRLR